MHVEACARQWVLRWVTRPLSWQKPRGQPYRLCPGLPDTVPVAVGGGVAGDEVGHVLLLVGLKVEGALLLRGGHVHGEGDAGVHNVHSHTLQLLEAVLRHDLGTGVGGGEGGEGGGVRRGMGRGRREFNLYSDCHF